MYLISVIFFTILASALSVDPMVRSSRCKSNGPLSLCLNNIRNENNFTEVKYFNGEMMYAECEQSKKQKQELFFKNKGNIVYTTKHKHRDGRVAMLVKMTAAYEDAVFECTSGNITLVYSISLDNSSNNPLLLVNGLVLGHGNFAYFRNSDDEHIDLSLHDVADLVISANEVQEDTSSLKFSYSNKTFNLEIIPKSFGPRHHVLTNIEIGNGNPKQKPLLIEMEEICGELCFEPHITGLDPSKVLAKYIHSNNISVIKYELDFEEDVVYFGCAAPKTAGGQLFVNEKQTTSHQRGNYNEQLFKLYTKNGTTTHLKRINCTLTDRLYVSSTIVDITRRKKMPSKSPTIKRPSDSKEIRRKKENGTLHEGLCTETPKTMSVLVSSVVTMILTVVIMIIIYKVYWKFRSTESVEGTRLQSTDINSSEIREPTYEPVNYEACKSGREDPVVNIANRAPFPLPPEELEENKKYIHYDTPYEHRIFRLGVRPRGRGPPSGRRHHNVHMIRRH